MCRPKYARGLGIGCLKEINMVFLSKWLWRFSLEHGSLKHSTIFNKYDTYSNG